MKLKLLAAALLAWVLAAAPAAAQSPHWPDYKTLQTQMFFGLFSADGNGVSEQEWATFVREVVTPRFPDGLTVLNAYGQGTSTPAATGVESETTKMLIVVHENTNDAQSKFAEIKAEYRTRFGQKGVFHVDFPARIVE